MKNIGFIDGRVNINSPFLIVDLMTRNCTVGVTNI